MDRYPSLYFFGASDFKQRISGLNTSLKHSNHIARYEGELYLLALIDWVWLMSKISWYDRFKSYVGSFFVWKRDSRALEKRIEELDLEARSLRKRLTDSEEKINHYETLELFDSLHDEGDAFIQLHADNPEPVCACITIFYSIFKTLRKI